MPAPVRRTGVERHAAILDAALAVFAERGLANTGVEDVRRAARASPSSLYHLFDGLQDIAVTLLERTFDRLLAHLTERVVAVGDAEGAVRALVRTHIEWVLAHRDEARFMYEATSLELGAGAAERVLARKAAVLGPMVAHLAAFAERGELPAWSAEQLDVVLLGPAHEACRRLLAGADLDAAWMLRELPPAAWRSVGRVGDEFSGPAWSEGHGDHIDARAAGEPPATAPGTGAQDHDRGVAHPPR